MSAKHIPYFDFYPADFMNGVRGLTPQEVGVYTMILCRIYEESGPVELHHDRLATYCGMRVKTFERVIDRLIQLGKFQLVDGALYNARAIAEISNRANKLKNNSRAGKASAQKRKEKQCIHSTSVQQTFNHTDTDTDNKPPIAPQTVEPITTTADPPERAEPMGLAETELIGLKAGIMAAFREAGSMTLAPDTHRAATWLAQGHKPAIILATIREVLARKPNVKALSYFDNPIREAHETAAKAPAETSQPMEEGKRLNALRGIVECWQKSPGSWPHGLGPQPDQPDTRIPGNILAEFGITPATRRAA